MSGAQEVRDRALHCRHRQTLHDRDVLLEKVAPVDADAVLAGLGPGLDLVLDGGPCQLGQPSTILDLSGPTPRIIRSGAVPDRDLGIQ